MGLPLPTSLDVFHLVSIVEMIHGFPEADFALDVSGIGLTRLFLGLSLGGRERADSCPLRPK